MIFEWDREKDERNQQTRDVSFALAAEVFDDAYRLTFEDVRYAYGEQRFITFGHIARRLFCVVYTMRDETIRIISARKANKKELNRYVSHLLQRSE
jgi:uncharacterized DUF497 family protein